MPQVFPQRPGPFKACEHSRVAWRPPAGALTSSFGEAADVSASSARGGGAVTHPDRAPPSARLGARERASRCFLILAPAALVGSGEVKTSQGDQGAGGRGSVGPLQARRRSS